MKTHKLLWLALSLVFLLICVAVFSITRRPDFRHDLPEKSTSSHRSESRNNTSESPEHPSRQVDSLARQRDENLPATASRDEISRQLTPSQVAGRVFPKVDLDALAFRMPEEKFAAYERMREEFPNVDWTEVDPTYRAFMDKRLQLPLNLNDEQREAHAAWLAKADPVRQELVRLRAEAQGLVPTGEEKDRGYFVDGFREGVPQYVYAQNANAAVSTGVSFMRSNPDLYPYLGDTVTGSEAHMTVSDVGEVFENPEFQLPNNGGSRILYKSLGGSVPEHSTHVTGTMGAWGYTASLQGMAPRGWLRTLINLGTSHLTTWGMATPGQQTGELNPRTGTPQLKSVVGNASLGRDYLTTRYNSMSQSYDIASRDYPYYMFFTSSGNERGWTTSGFETLSGEWKVSKNTISVGSVDDVTRDSQGAITGGGALASSSSSGPTYDGRIKPDFVGNGVYLTSPVSLTTTGVKSGTSMASPNVAGSVALLMDYVRQRLPQQYLRHPTYKALLMSTTDDLGNSGPDYSYGWGLVNVHDAAKIIRQHAESSAKRLIIEDSLSPSQTWTESYDTDGSKPIRVSIAWLDPEGADDSADSTHSPRLINDLDVRLIGPGNTVYFPYVMPYTTGQGATPAFDATLYNATAVTGDNITDPMEQVRIATPVAGTYVVQVTHKGTLKDNQAQLFSVAISGLSKQIDLPPVQAYSFTEAVAQDGKINPGEDALGTVTLVNRFVNPYQNVIGRITTSDPDVTILSDTVTYGTLTSKQSSSGTGAFRIRLASGKTPHTVALTLTITSTSDDPFVYPITCAYVDSAAISGYVRNGLGSPIAGATVSWTGTRTGQVISGSNGYYAIAEVDGTYAVSASATGFVTSAPVSLTVPPSRTQDLTLDFYDLAVTPTPLSLQAGSGQTASSPLTLTNTGSLPVPWTVATEPYLVTTSGQAGGPAYVWNDISATGTQITGLTDDTNLGPFPIGFNMPFYGQNFNQFRVCSNGWLSFTNTTLTDYNTTSTNKLPSTSRPENLIAPLLRDQVLTTAGTVHYQQLDGDTFVVQFTNAPRYKYPASLSTFQVVMKRDGTILLYYQRADDPTVGLVGMQNAAKNEGITLAYNQAFLSPSFAVRIQPTWLGFTPSSGTIPVGSTATVTVSGNTAGLASGNYAANLIVNSNDGNTPVQTVPVNFTVGASPPSITTWPTATSLVYGQALSASTLSGGSSSVAGSFAFSAPTTVPSAGTQSVPVTFTPTDTANYSPVTGSVSVVVAKATPVVTAWPTASSITSGQPLSASTLSGGTASVAGSFTFNSPTTVLNPGTQSVAVTFTPAVTANYQTVAGTVQVQVQGGASVTVTAWPTASGIVYGQALSVSTLTGGTASVTGTFTFNSPNTVLNAGTQSVAVTFTPTDAATYNSAQGSVSVVVAKATPVITASPTASAIVYGQALSASTLSGGTASVAGTFAFSSPTTLPNAGTQSVPVTFTPTDTANYNPAQGSVSIVVAKATPVITASPTASAIVYGQALSVSTLTGGTASVTGSFAFSAPTTVLNAGTHSVAVTLTPADTVNYNPASGSVSIVVAKATPVITTWPTASAINPNQYLSASTLSGGSASEAGAFAFSDAALQFTGQDSFTFRVSDGTLVSGPATVSLTVGAPAAAPAAMAPPLAPNAVAPATSIRADGYTLVTFAESGTWTVPIGVTSVEALVVGGGGGGAGYNKNWGGGGAGGFISSSSYTVTSGASMAVTVGAGGAGGSPTADNATDGGLSQFGQLIAYGGKAGRAVGGDSGGNSSNGGSTINPGYTGGTSGGSGAGAGQNGANNWFSGGPGGSGKASNIVGSAVYYGGGGGVTYGAALGGLGGGGNGSVNNANASPGVNGLGGGGGASRQGTGGNGGLGVVIVAYIITNSPPIANAQSVTVELGTPKAITLTGSDPDGNALSYVILTQPTYGTLSGTAPNVTYTPPALPVLGAHDVTVTFTPTDTANYHSVTGTVSVTVNAATTPYSQWVTQYPSYDLSNPNSDLDKDGMSNFQEYAFGLNPTTPSAGVISYANGVVTDRGGPRVIQTVDDVDFQAVFARRKDYLSAGLVYQVHFSSDLATWVTSVVTPTVVASDAEVEAVTLPYPITVDTPRGPEKPKFFRVYIFMP